jgi:hypothetical protein
MKPTPARWLRYLLIILVGNALYFVAMPHLPAAARHQRFELDLGTVVDFWFCLVVFGILELLEFFHKRAKR